MAIRAPLDFLSPLTGGSPNIRAPLVFTGVVSYGAANVRNALTIVQPLTGGNPNLRCALIIIQALIPIPEPLPVATYVFPTLRGGMKWDRVKNPSGNNARREMTSGRRSVTPFMTYPRWNFELSYTVMPDTRYLSGMNNTLSPIQSIIDLFKNTLFGAYTFLYQDPDDYHIVSGSIATADGVTLQWPFFAGIMGTVLEPVGQIDLSVLETFISTAVNTGTNQINIPSHGLLTGQSPPVFISNPGTLPVPLAASTPYWVIVVDADHIKLATTLPQALAGTAITVSAAGSGTNTLTKGWAAYETIVESRSVPGSGPYTVTATHAATYASDGGVTSSGTPLVKVASSPATGQYSVNVATGVYTFNSAQASATVLITYTWQNTGVSLTMPNQLVFGSAPASGAIITADFDYYFVCRFDDDKLETNEFSKRLYELQKVAFSSEVG